MPGCRARSVIIGYPRDQAVIEITPGNIRDFCNYMAFSRRSRDKQVRLTVFDNEPLARLAEQRLRQAGISCFIRSLRGGPGLWGSAYNLPHDLYVYASDEIPAREVLDLEPEGLEKRETYSPPSRSNSNIWVMAAGVILAVLTLAIVVSVFSRPG